MDTRKAQNSRPQFSQRNTLDRTLALCPPHRAHRRHVPATAQSIGVGRLAGLVPRGGRLRGPRQLDRQQVQRFVGAAEAVRVRGGAPDDLALRHRDGPLRQHREPRAADHDHPLLGVGVRVRVRDLVRREALQRQVGVLALVDRHPTEARGARGDDVGRHHAEDAEVVEHLRQFAHVMHRAAPSADRRAGQ